LLCMVFDRLILMIIMYDFLLVDILGGECGCVFEQEGPSG